MRSSHTDYQLFKLELHKLYLNTSIIYELYTELIRQKLFYDSNRTKTVLDRLIFLGWVGRRGMKGDIRIFTA